MSLSITSGKFILPGRLAYGPDDTSVPAELRPLLFPPGKPAFAVIDAAKVFGLPQILEASGLRHECLYTGQAREEMGAAAPWLAELKEGHDLTRQIFAEGASGRSVSHMNGATMLLVARDGEAEMDFAAVHAHLRRFTKVRAEDGSVMLLRFYDPLTFRDLLEAMPGWQLALLHGPLRFICIDADARWTASEALSRGEPSC